MGIRLDLSFSDIYLRVSEFIGLGASPSGTNLTLVKDIVYRAYRQLLYPVNPNNGKQHVWSWLKKRFVLLTEDSKYKYTLPIDFDKMLGNPQHGTDSPYPELTRVMADDVLSARSSSDTESFPLMYAIVPASHDIETGSMWEIWLWPTPNGEYPIHFQYIISPEKPAATTDYFLGGPRVAETILQMSLAVAEQQEENVIGVQSQLADKMLSQLVLSDNVDVPDTLGRMGIDAMRDPRGFKRFGTDDVYSAESGTACDW